MEKPLKNKIYYYNQDLQENGDLEDVQAQLKDLTNQHQEMAKKILDLGKETNKLESGLSDEQLGLALGALIREDAGLDLEIAGLKEGDPRDEARLGVDEENMEKFGVESGKLAKERDLRVRLFRGLLRDVAECAGMKRGELLEEVGVEEVFGAGE